MKTIAVVTATLAITLAFAGTASADSVTVTRTGVDVFGNQKSVTKTIDSSGNRSTVSQSVDRFGNRRTVTRNDSDNGLVHCRIITLRSTDALGDSASRTMRRCAPDGADF